MFDFPVENLIPALKMMSSGVGNGQFILSKDIAVLDICNGGLIYTVSFPHFKSSKKFKKWLMANGYSRNAADTMIKEIGKGNGKYPLSMGGYFAAREGIVMR